MDGARLAADAIAGAKKQNTKHRMETTGDLPRENNNRFTSAALSRDRTWRLHASVNPNFFQCLRLWRVSWLTQAMTQRGACRDAAGPERVARVDAPKVGLTEGSDRLPAAPLSSETFRGPEVLRPCLATGLPLSAFGQEAAVHSSKLDRRSQGVLLCTSFPESSQARTARVKYRHKHDRNKGEFVAHRRHNAACARLNGNELKAFQ